MQRAAREGELYKVLTVFGISFPLYYGYYDERERDSRYSEPIPIYPDFIKQPRYTANGLPFVTAMQSVCPHYKGQSPEDGCHTCSHYQSGEEFLGICLHEGNRERQNE
ncbi:MAG: hypothetical protein IJY20_04080 [Clostridia bacterium]|nr:hypothetical protein [Clostridia bacterium]